MLEATNRSRSLLVSIVSAMLLSACSSVASKKDGIDDVLTPREVALNEKSLGYVDAVSDLPNIFSELAQYRVVFVGEQHDRLDHHVIQLDVIEYLHSLGTPLAIGLEFFQQPFQATLDAYVAGRIDEQEMLEKTEYFSRWAFDYRLYAPILRFARENSIPLVALNVPSDIVRQTSREGLASLDARQASFVPKNIDRNVIDYEARIRDSFEAHEGIDMGALDNFIDAQLLWDEGMAEAAASYLLEQPERLLVILAGAGHIEYRTGIPVRLERRIFSPVATVLPTSKHASMDAARADYQIDSTEITLPKKGLMGVLLDESERGIYALSFTENSAAEKAGMLPGDFIRSINSSTIKEYADIKLTLWDANPGEIAVVTVERHTADSSKVLEFRLLLH